MVKNTVADEIWGEWIFARSVLKQEKFRQIARMLGELDGQHCLDLGSDNGVLSLKLRQLGGVWKSADIDPRSTAAATQLVRTRVYTIDGKSTPFSDEEFDRVVVVDLLEHIPDDKSFMLELNRILKPAGKLIINVPYLRDNALTRFREFLGLTDEMHGHLRPGYKPEDVKDLLDNGFKLEELISYTGLASKLLDSMLVAVLSRITKSGRKGKDRRGLIVTDRQLNKHNRLARFYSMTYPLIRLISWLDRLLFFDPGYMLIAKAETVSQTGSDDRVPEEIIRTQLLTAGESQV